MEEGTEINVKLSKYNNIYYEIGDEKINGTIYGTYLNIFRNSKIVINKKIGEGSYSYVYLCSVYYEDIISFRPIVLKVEKNSIDSKTNEIPVFNMIRSMNKNFFKYVIIIYGYFKFNNNRCIIMENCEEGDMIKFINNQRYSLNVINKIALSICRSLLHLHRSNIIHGDLKPDNILIFKRKKGYIAKLSDFGLSNVYSEGNCKTVKKNLKNRYEKIISDKYNNRYNPSNTYATFFKPPIYGESFQIGIKKDLYMLGITLLQLHRQEDSPFPAFDKSNPETLSKIQSDPNIIKNAIKDFYEDEQYPDYVREIVLYCVRESEELKSMIYIIERYSNNII